MTHKTLFLFLFGVGFRLMCEACFAFLRKCVDTQGLCSCSDLVSDLICSACFSFLRKCVDTQGLCSCSELVFDLICQACFAFLRNCVDTQGLCSCSDLVFYLMCQAYFVYPLRFCNDPFVTTHPLPNPLFVAYLRRQRDEYAERVLALTGILSGVAKFHINNARGGR